MSDWLERTTCRNLAGMVLTIVAALVLSSCGFGGDDDDSDATSTSEPAGVTTQSAQESGSVSESPAASLSPDQGGLESPASGTPGSAGASPTPGIVVSAPPIAMPTQTPEPPAAATPSSGGSGVSSTQAVIASDVTVGDGTGGALATAVSGEGGSASPEASAPVASPVSGDAIASGCDFTAYPPFTGEVAEQVTTVDVNFRAGPGQDCDIIGEPIAAGVTVQVLSDPVQRVGDDEFLWVFVSIDGTEGWLTTELLEPAA